MNTQIEQDDHFMNISKKLQVCMSLVNLHYETLRAYNKYESLEKTTKDVDEYSFQSKYDLSAR